VSRDALREEFFGRYTNYNRGQEDLITSVAQKTVDYVLSKGGDVVVHDMNLRKRYRKQWAQYAVKHNADFFYVDLTGVPLHVCLERNGARGLKGGRYVDPEVIESNHKRYLSNKQAIETPESLVDEIKWVPKGHDPVGWISGLPEAIIVDIDGTVADHEGVRDPYDTTKYHLDKPKLDVIKVVQDYAYRPTPPKIILCSGRLDEFWNVTYEWIMEHVKVPVEMLVMREREGTRDDEEKLMLFDKHIRGKYNIRFVLDDRNRVVKAWRSIGLTVFQVAEGDF
jgi:predicted kinase